MRMSCVRQSNGLDDNGNSARKRPTTCVGCKKAGELILNIEISRGRFREWRTYFDFVNRKSYIESSILKRYAVK